MSGFFVPSAIAGLKFLDPLSKPLHNAAMDTHAGNATSSERALQAMRQQAETIVRETTEPSIRNFETMSLEDIRRTFHELSLYQIELEMQNEELRRTQIALDAERERYFDLYDLAPVGYCTVSETGQILQINLTAATLLGVPRGSLVNRMFQLRIFHEDQDIYYRHRLALLSTGERQSCELRMVRHDGTPVWMQLTATTATSTNNAPALRITLSDITERKLAEDTLQHNQAQQADETLRQNQTLLKSEAFSRAIMDSVDAEIAVLDSNGLIVAVNQPWRTFASANSLVPGQASPLTDVGSNYLAVCESCIDAISGDAASSASKGIREVINGSAPHFTLEYACDTPLQKQWFSMHVTPLGQERQGVVISHTNITQAKQAKAALSLTRFSIEAASEAMFWITPEARIVDVNAAACRLFGYTREELLQLSVTDMAAESGDAAERWRKHFAELRQSGSKKLEAAHRAKDGSLISVEVIANYVQFDGKEYSCAFVRDITGRKQHAELILAAKAEAENANRAKSRFLAAASHDLRQPLSALSLYLGVLQGRIGPEHNDLMARIQACCDSLSQLLSDLLDVSKLDAGVIAPKLSDFAVGDFLNGLIAVHSAEAGLKGLRLHSRPCNTVVARTDRNLLARIVNNLIANAIRYTGKGGVLIACRRREGRQWIEVWDTGMGIPGDKTEAIFEEFTQLGDDARNRGSGLGLAIVSKMAAVLNLKIRVRSQLGRGSVFAIELPLGRSRLPAEPQAQQPQTRQLRIGVVEDHPDVRQALSLALENMGHEVVAAANGHTLIKHLGKRAPDIVISDYRLGAGETGFQAIEAARGTFGAQLPAIIITGDTDPTLIRSMTNRGIVLHFKPLHLDTLRSFITQATERRAS